MNAIEGGGLGGMLTSCADCRSSGPLGVAAVPPRQSGCVHIGAAIEQHAHDTGASTGARSVYRQASVEERVDRLSVRQGVVHETDVTTGGGRVQFKVWVWLRLANSGPRRARDGDQEGMWDGVRWCAKRSEICNVLKPREATTNLGQHTGVHRADVRAAGAGAFGSTTRRELQPAAHATEGAPSSADVADGSTVEEDLAERN